MKKVEIQEKIFFITIYLITSLLLGYVISNNVKNSEPYSLINITLMLITSAITLFVQYLIYTAIFRIINKKNVIGLEKDHIFIGTMLSLLSSNILYIILLTALRNDYYYFSWFSVGLGITVFILYNIKWFDIFNINKKIRLKYFVWIIIINILFTLLSI